MISMIHHISDLKLPLRVNDIGHCTAMIVKAHFNVYIYLILYFFIKTHWKEQLPFFA
jgi:hypothetical protein